MKVDVSKSLRGWQRDYMLNKKRFNVLVVHRRGGKTVWAILDQVLCMIGRDEWVHDYWYIAPTYKQAKSIAWEMLQKFGNQIWDFTFNSSELFCRLPNGSTIKLFGAENPDSLRWLDLRWVVFDEYAHHLTEHILTPKEKEVWEIIHKYSKKGEDFMREYSQQNSFEDMADTISFTQMWWKTCQGRICDIKEKYAKYIIRKYY